MYDSQKSRAREIQRPKTLFNFFLLFFGVCLSKIFGRVDKIILINNDLFITQENSFSRLFLDEMVQNKHLHQE